MITMTDLCEELHNWDFNRRAARYHGTYHVVDNQIDLTELVADGSIQQDQYFRVVGSVFCDGVYKYGTDTLPHDETFTGVVWAMYVPPEIYNLLDEINEWMDTEEGKKLSSPYSSESFGGYSYSLKSNMTQDANASGAGAWKAQFKTKLDRWRKLP